MSENEKPRSGMDMIFHHRFRLAEDGNCAEIDSSGLAEEIDAALTAAEARIKMLSEALDLIARPTSPERLSGAHLTGRGRAQLAFAMIDNFQAKARQALTHGASNDG
jgi:hypothetical protein